jgi:hypothetical protein
MIASEDRGIAFVRGRAPPPCLWAMMRIPVLFELLQERLISLRPDADMSDGAQRNPRPACCVAAAETRGATLNTVAHSLSISPFP